MNVEFLWVGWQSVEFVQVPSTKTSVVLDVCIDMMYNMVLVGDNS
jgi:hypothetical protein